MEVSLLELLTSPSTNYSSLSPYISSLSSSQPQIPSLLSPIKTILSSSLYKINSKLLTVRLLKDCFTQGNQQFINQVEIEVLPLMRKILEDRLNENLYCNYVEKDCMSRDEVGEFKSKLMSLFQLVEECVENWAEWMGDEKQGRNGYVGLLASMNEGKLMQGGNRIYFTQQNKMTFKENWINRNRNKALDKNRTQNIEFAKNRPSKDTSQNSSIYSIPPYQISQIMKRVDNLVEFPKQKAKKQIITLTNDLERVSRTLSPAVKESVQKQFQNRLIRVSRISVLNKKQIDKVNQIESEHEMTIAEESQISNKSESGKCFELQMDSFMGNISNDKGNKANVMKQRQSNFNNVRQEQSFKLPLQSKINKQSKNKQNINSTAFQSPESTLLDHKLSEISLWSQVLKSKLSPTNITNFKLAILKQNKLLYQDHMVSIFFTFQNLSEQNQTYKLRLHYKLSSSFSRFSWINTHPELLSSAPVEFSSQQYKQLITIKNLPTSQLIFWRIQIDNQPIQFPLPYTVLNILLKGLVSRQTVSSCLKPQLLQSPVFYISEILSVNRDIMKYFPHGLKGKTSVGVECLSSCLLHEGSNTMLVLNVEYWDEDRLKFKINLIEANREEIAHGLLECLMFIFQRK